MVLRSHRAVTHLFQRHSAGGLRRRQWISQTPAPRQKLAPPAPARARPSSGLSQLSYARARVFGWRNTSPPSGRCAPEPWRLDVRLATWYTRSLQVTNKELCARQKQKTTQPNIATYSSAHVRKSQTPDTCSPPNPPKCDTTQQANRSTAAHPMAIAALLFL